MRPLRLESQLVVGPEKPSGLSHVRPLDLSTTYRTPDPAAAAASMDQFADGAAEAANPVYARLANPNVREFEDRMTALEGGSDSVAFASGMAAIAALVLDASHRGGHVVAVPPLYGGTQRLLNSGLFGLEVTWSAPDDVRRSIRPNTALVLVETPANPTLTVCDIAQLATDAQGVPVAVDSTFATPVLQNPLRHGAAYVVHSATKFIGGRGDALGGVVTALDVDAVARLRLLRIATGAILHPLAAHAFCGGLQTLALRVRAQQSNAQRLVGLFEGHPEVLQVGYPGAESGQSDIVARQMAGPGSLMTVRLKGGAQRADAFISQLRVAVPAVSLGTIDTLVQRPLALTHRTFEGEDVQGTDISEDLIRISVGAEHVDDLWSDFEAAIVASESRVALAC